jgi:hypothetical protein
MAEGLLLLAGPAQKNRERPVLAGSKRLSLPSAIMVQLIGNGK